MSWSRFDDRYAQHPKLVALGDFYEVGMALDVAGVGWCNLNETDGVVPKAHVAGLIRCTAMRIGKVRVTPELVAQKLVAVGRWEDAGDAYRIHDFLEYNPSRAQKVAQRKATADRVQKHRNARRNGVTEPLVTGEKHESTPPPVPGPVPEGSSTESESGTVADLLPNSDRGRSNHEGQGRGDGPPLLETDVQQLFVDAGLPDAVAEYRAFQRHYSERPPGPDANWRVLAEGWIARIPEFGAAAERRRRRGTHAVHDLVASIGRAVPDDPDAAARQRIRDQADRLRAQGVA